MDNEYKVDGTEQELEVLKPRFQPLFGGRKQMILTNKRLYCVKTEGCSGFSFDSYVDLENITGVHFMRTRINALLVLAALNITLIWLILSRGPRSKETIWMVAFLTIATIVELIIFFLPSAALCFQYAGGSISMKCTLVSRTKIIAFRNNVQYAKERIEVNKVYTTKPQKPANASQLGRKNNTDLDLIF